MRFHNIKIYKEYNVGDYECNVCGKKFKSKKILQTHTGVHNPIFCRNCDKAFAQKQGFLKHMKSFHPDPLEQYQCPQCAAYFENADKFNLHIQSHSIKKLEKY